ncbi:6288_t:CDS:1, partial [Ambispora gerdemannii]
AEPMILAPLFTTNLSLEISVPGPGDNLTSLRSNLQAEVPPFKIEYEGLITTPDGSKTN